MEMGRIFKWDENKEWETICRMVIGTVTQIGTKTGMGNDNFLKFEAEFRG